MIKLLDRIPRLPLALLAVFMLLAPFRPMPHVVEKLMMLRDGNLARPLDIVDLIFHLAPTAVLLVKWLRGLKD